VVLGEIGYNLVDNTCTKDKGDVNMETINFIDDSLRKTIIKEITESLYVLGVDIKDIILDINAETVNLKICICNK